MRRSERKRRERERGGKLKERRGKGRWGKVKERVDGKRWVGEGKRGK